MIDIALVSRDSMRDGPADFVWVDLNTAPAYTLVIAQPCQQLALAAAQVENAGARFHQLGDHRVVWP